MTALEGIVEHRQVTLTVTAEDRPSTFAAKEDLAAAMDQDIKGTATPKKAA